MSRNDRFGIHLIVNAFGPLTSAVLGCHQWLASNAWEWLCSVR